MKKFIVNHVWLCHNCDSEIEPKLRIRIGNQKEEVPLFHPVSLRNLLETYASVDLNYRDVFQKKMSQLRSNKSIFWNLIFFFQLFDLYFDFIVPYREKQPEYNTSDLIVRQKESLIQRMQRQGGVEALKQKQEKLTKQLKRKVRD